MIDSVVRKHELTASINVSLARISMSPYTVWKIEPIYSMEDRECSMEHGR